MMAPKKKKRSRPKTQFNYLHDFLSGPNVRTLIGAAAVLTAFLYLDDKLFRPVYESGPLPVPSRAEVDKLREETSMSFDSVRKNVNEQTEVIKQITQKAAQDAAETRASRVTRLIAQRTTLSSLVEMNPNDQTLRNLLEQTNTQIIQLQTEIARDSSQVLLPPVQQQTPAIK